MSGSPWARLRGLARALGLSVKERLKTRRSRVELARAPVELEAFRAAFGLPEDPRNALSKLEPGPWAPPFAQARALSAELLAARCPEHRSETLAAAEEVRAHRFDLLGSGPTSLGAEIDWLSDFKTGARWPVADHLEIPIKLDPEGPEDIKVPWELSRFGHAVVLARAWRLSGDQRYSDELFAQLDSWLAMNPYGRTCNWKNAMEVAIRAVNWLVALELVDDAPGLDPPRRLALLHSLYLHAHYIASNLEVYGTITSNHYLSDGLGLLYIAELFPAQGPVPGWRATAREIVFGEMAVQVHADGVDYENCPGYHRLVLELFLYGWLLLRAHGEPPPATGFLERLEKMFEFSLHILDPQHGAPPIGDADDGRLLILAERAIDDHRGLLALGAALFERGDLKARAGSPAPAELCWALGEEGLARYDALEASSEPLRAGRFEAAGYFVSHGPRGQDHLVLDFADVGIRDQGSHGHDDLLSFTLSLWSERVIVDPGPFVYTASPTRRFEARSARNHNLVVVDDAEMSGLREDYLWMTPEPAPRIIHQASQGEDEDFYDAEHHGYRRLEDPVDHRRRFVFSRAQRWLAIADELRAEASHSYRLQFLTPLLDIEPCEPPAGMLEDARALLEARGAPLPDPATSARVCWVLRGQSQSFVLAIEAPPGAQARVEEAERSPSYGAWGAARRLSVELESEQPPRFVSVLGCLP